MYIHAFGMRYILGYRDVIYQSYLVVLYNDCCACMHSYSNSAHSYCSYIDFVPNFFIHACAHVGYYCVPEKASFSCMDAGAGMYVI